MRRQRNSRQSLQVIFLFKMRIKSTRCTETHRTHTHYTTRARVHTHINTNTPPHTHPTHNLT